MFNDYIKKIIEGEDEFYMWEDKAKYPEDVDAKDIVSIHFGYNNFDSL